MATKICLSCNKAFEPKRSDALYCSKKCKMRAKRDKDRKAKKVQKPTVIPAPIPEESYDDVADAIDDARRVSHRFGQLANTAPRPVRPGCARIGAAIAAAIETEEW